MKIFNKDKLSVTVPFVLLLSLFVALAINGYNQKKIFILQSYYPDYGWTKGVDDGLKSILGNQHLVRYRTFYMDTKRNPSEAYKRKAAALAKSMIAAEKPDVLITVDDNAQSYVAKHYNNRPDMATVFLGVNNSAEAYGYDKAKNVTGFLERIPVGAFVDLAEILLADKVVGRKIRTMHVGDRSSSVMLDDRNLRNHKDWKNVELLPSKLVNTFDQWKKAVLDANETIDILLLTNAGQQIVEEEGSEKLIGAKKIIEWTLENFKGSIIGMNDFLIEDGLPIAVSVSPTDTGTYGASTAMRIINEKIKPLDVSSKLEMAVSDRFIVSMKLEDIKKYDWNLPEIYSSFSYAIGRML